MHSIKTALKAKLIELQKAGKLPADMNQLDIDVFDEPLKPVKEELQTLQKSCEEALDETWDRSDDGFQAMIDNIDTILNR